MLLHSVIVASLATLVRSYTFVPENGSALGPDAILANLPVPYNLSTSQTLGGSVAFSSFWSSSFLHASNGHDYMLISHTMPNLSIGASTGFYRASLVDITDPSYYVQSVVDANSTVGASSTFNLTYDHYGYEALSDDHISLLHTWSTIPDLGFDLTINGTSTALLDGAVGTFYFGTDTPVYEWGMPACETSGTFEVNGETLTVDPSRSLTWYDRQWSGGLVRSWTWFEVHLESEEGDMDIPVKASIWIIDPVTGPRIQFSTIRYEDGIQEVVSVSSYVAHTYRVYDSPVFGLVYPLDWTLGLADGTGMNISSIRPDQEMVGSSQVTTVYEGFVDVAITDKNGKNYAGFGVVEIVNLPSI